MASNEVDYQGKQANGRLAGAKNFVYNKNEKTVFGRTCSSWGKIFVFYMIYYSCLAGFFAMCIAVFFTTLDKDHPRQQDLQSLIKGNPGMGFRPMPDVDSTLISFEQGKQSSYKKYTDLLNAHIELYENDKQTSEDFDDCTDGEAPAGKICRFSKDMLGDECTWDKAFGYDTGTPCVLLKLNKVYGWEPKSYANNTTPEDYPGEAYDDQHISITCQGENAADTENMGEVEFYPKNGIHFKYFPYLNQQGYLQPVVFARFKKPTYGVVMQLWCKAWADNIYHHKNDKAGSIHFELLVD